MWRSLSSSNGQAFLTTSRGKASGAYNARHGHGREASSLFYTHVSVRHAPYHMVLLLPSGEAAYAIDGLFYHDRRGGSGLPVGGVLRWAGEQELIQRLTVVRVAQDLLILLVEDNVGRL